MVRPSLRDCRGVSALIGYLLVFAVVISGAVLVSAMGISVLLDSGDRPTDDLAERNLARLDEGFDALESGAPYRELRLDPVDAGLTYGEPFTVRITASGGGVDLTGGDAVVASGRAIRYELDGGGTLSYVGGLLAYEQANGSRAVLRAGPEISDQGERLLFVVPLPGQAPRSPTLVSGADTVPVVLDRSSVGVVRRSGTTATGSDTSIDGTITIEGGVVPGAWRAYFADHSAFEPTDLDGDGDREYVADTDGDGTPDVAGAEFSTERLYVRTVTAGVTLSETL